MCLLKKKKIRCGSRMKGFSYIEIIFTVAILALLATAAVPYAELSVTRKKEVELKRNLRDIRTAIDAYKKAVDDGRITMLVDQSGYPHSLDELVIGVEDIKDPQKKKIYFLRRLPRDPMFPEQDELPALTWGKRSYDSDPEFPQEGADVFDVYSLSEQEGLNGVPYNQW
ncbi:MAG: type II secretion system protein [Piscirickettsiaceae bacterium]|nr:type II secretion system protein [Piscirickettsiaceae bacterium]